MSSEYASDRHINLNHLEWECARQADLFHKWGTRWATACQERDTAHEKVKTIRSEKIEYLRKNWSKLGYTKEPSQTLLESYYRSDNDYKEAKKTWIKAETNARMMYVAMKAFEHKRSMLEVEQRLYSQEYFGTPYIEPEFTKITGDATAESHVDQLDDPEQRLGQRLIKRRM